MSSLLPTATNRPALTAKACAWGVQRIDRVDLGVEDDEIGILHGIDRGNRGA